MLVNRTSKAKRKEVLRLMTFALPLCPKHPACPECSFMGQIAIFIVFLIYDE